MPKKHDWVFQCHLSPTFWVGDQSGCLSWVVTVLCPSSKLTELQTLKCWTLTKTDLPWCGLHRPEAQTTVSEWCGGVNSSWRTPRRERGRAFSHPASISLANPEHIPGARKVEYFQVNVDLPVNNPVDRSYSQKGPQLVIWLSTQQLAWKHSILSTYFISQFSAVRSMHSLPEVRKTLKNAKSSSGWWHWNTHLFGILIETNPLPPFALPDFWVSSQNCLTDWYVWVLGLLLLWDQLQQHQHPHMYQSVSYSQHLTHFTCSSLTHLKSPQCGISDGWEKSSDKIWK